MGSETNACVYMLRCADGTLYTGWTNDIAKRLAAHQAGSGAKYTKSRRPVQLVYVERAETKQQALRRECAIKRLSRREKLALAESWKGPASV
ncbi:GIY-YIG nuclease family protein [Christensenella tenuis]|jgi:putative endonuclease|uniref:GIY-YIG nuclease family protein n=1 Tax=Christensenella tenuis TaxID=2763033 RepID=A0ABR7EEZ5_9FIRM|nr:GIY-YIG nuclease family protein [Christensenella tenuis]MBC5648337.1 GIY-YIG nuclease family protein [Christensenella tenuis]